MKTKGLTFMEAVIAKTENYKLKIVSEYNDELIVEHSKEIKIKTNSGVITSVTVPDFYRKWEIVIEEKVTPLLQKLDYIPKEIPGFSVKHVKESLQAYFKEVDNNLIELTKEQKEMFRQIRIKYFGEELLK